jgi:hypothetical protein
VTVVAFAVKLTAQEQQALDDLMSEKGASLCEPPATPGTRFVIEDIQRKLDAFNQRTGENFELWFSASQAGGEIDQIELHAGRTLDASEKQKVKDAWLNQVSVVDG